MLTQLYFLLLGFAILTNHQANSEQKTAYDYGALEITSTQHNEPACFTYPMDYFTFSPEVIYTLKNTSHINICNHNFTSDDLTSDLPKSESLFLLTADGNCSVASTLPFVAENATGLILISPFRYRINNTFGLTVFAVVTPENAHGLQQVFNSTDKIKVRIYGGGGVDASTAVLGIIAVLCIVIGSYSGPYGSIPGRARQEQRILDGSAVPTAARPSEVPITITTILVLVIFITVTLLSLYFFYEYLVYVFILIFCIASTRATYCIFIQLLCCCDFGMTPPKIRNYGLHEILLAVFCLSITIVWFIFRSSNFSWILQDFLGICFCIHVIQTLRLPNLKICAVLLGMLFVYDIFFVFITPLFMKNGKSIMVEVATGGGGNSTEQIPVLLKVPRLQGGPAADCNPGQYSLLGFGDIIIPGLLVCFAHTFDIMNALKFRPYFIVTSLGYTIGLFGAFIALYLMRTGQPALLYIVPAILVAIFSLGTCRKEVKALWRGTTTEMNMVADAGA